MKPPTCSIFDFLLDEVSRLEQEINNLHDRAYTAENRCKMLERELAEAKYDLKKLTIESAFKKI